MNADHETGRRWCVDAGERWCIIQAVSAVTRTTTTLCGFEVSIDSRREHCVPTCPRCSERARSASARSVTESDAKGPVSTHARSVHLLGGVLNVTREEFADIRRIMRGAPGCDAAEARAVCDRLGLEFDVMAFRQWTVKVVDEVRRRCEPPGASSSATTGGAA